ncbi:hypothetical protein GCM10023340_02120 [Nocardioides marinquilinus]|uniref:CBM6 domain-containing protein n=1 Tax=Nocardioides marinquilinus TaxID=1210400 RepID=A0ABP9P755_9ACTN
MTLSLTDRTSGPGRLRRLLGVGLAVALGAGMAAAVTAPTPASAAEPGTVYEAESQPFSGNSVQTEHNGFTGSGYVGGFGGTGSSLTTAVTAADAGTHDLFVRYANGGSSKTLTLEVNGAARQITLPGSGAWNSYGFVWASVDLQAGANSIVLRRAGTDSGSVNVDNLRVAPRVGTRYEAEDAALTSGARTASDHAGYTGTSFVGGFDNAGATVTFTVNAAEAGTHPATLRYGAGPNPFNGAKQVTLEVNGQPRPIVLPGFGSWKFWGDYALELPLNAGANTVAIRYLPGDNGNVNIDHLDVKAPVPPTCTGEVDPDDDFSGAELDRCRWTTVFNEEPSGYRLADGDLRIDARPGDLSGGTTSAKNVVLQQAPTGDWMAETSVSIDGTDDYLQAGLVVMGNAANFGKVAVIRTPTAGWKIELGRVTANNLQFSNSPTLADGAQTDVALRMWVTGGVLRGSYSLDDGATWSLVGNGYPDTGLGSPQIGVAAFNGTGAETASFDAFTVGAPERVASTTTLTAPSTRTVGQSAGVTVEVAVPGSTATGDVTLFDGDDVVGTMALTDGKATFEAGPFTTAGTRTLRASYAGDTGAAPSEATGTVEVVRAASQVTVSPSPAVVRTGQTSTVTVTVAAGDRTPTGLVTLNDGNGPVGTSALTDGVATFEVGPYDTTGVRTLTAGYDGDDAVAGGTASADLTVADEPVPSTTTISTDPTSVTVGKPATVTVSVAAAGGTPTGSVTLRDGEQVVGTSDLTDGKATFQVGPYATAGDRTLTAEYAGNATVAASSVNRTLTVVRAASTVSVSAAPSTVETGQTSTVTVTVSADGLTPSGSVVLRDGDTDLGSAPLVNGVATFQVGPYASAGTRTLTAQYAATDAVTAGSGSATLTVVPAPVASTVTISGPGSVAIGETAQVTVTVTAPGTTPGGTVTLREDGNVVGTAPLSGGVAAFQVGPYATAGDRALSASYAGSGTVMPGSATATLAVTKLAPTVTVSADPSGIAVGQTASVTVMVTAPGTTPDGMYALTDGVDGDVNAVGSLTGGTATVTVGPFDTTGTRTLTLDYLGSDTVAAGSATTTLQVTAAASTVTVTPAPGGVEAGSTTTVEVAVDAEGVTPTGEVVVTDGSAKQWSGTLTDGTVTVTVGPWAAAGRRTLTASYAGDGAVAAGSGTAALVVRAKPTPVVTVAPKVVDAAANRRTGTVKMTCKPAGVRCVGSVELRANGAALGTARFAVDGGRTATVKVSLNAKARTLLAKKSRVPANLAVTMAGKRTSVAVTLTR